MKDEIRAFVASELVTDAAEIGDDTSLFESRLIDSMNLIQLISFLEESYGVSIQPMDMTLENFDTIGRIERLVTEKKKA